MKFINLEYLRSGNERQRAAYDCLTSLGLFHLLRDYQPILTGTIPIDVDIADSDLDVICYSEDLASFRKLIKSQLGQQDGFSEYATEIAGVPSAVANFNYLDFKIEVFCQPIPTQKQNAYIHMVVEARLLDYADSSVRSKIRELKSSGMKTEPAFAEVFKLSGNPYQKLLELNNASESEIQTTARRWP